MMDCHTVREHLKEYAAGRLEAAERSEVAGHLEGCADCRQTAAVEAELSAALGRLPRHDVPEALKRRLEGLVASAATTAAPNAAPVPATATSRRRAPGRWTWAWTWAAPFVSACAAAALVLVVVTSRTTAPRSTGGGPSDLVTEAVNDHLRVISSSRPVEIESGGIHQVKPWFTGRLDFAPRVAFSGDGDFPLVGGSVGYFHDRKAAVFVFKRRLHTITLLVLPPDGLDWPAERLTRLRHLSIAEETSRGFSVLLWRDGGLGYALISDVDSHDLEMLAARINPE
jgi:anti-sigma factor RsiW